jgi:hypothetical protein
VGLGRGDLLGRQWQCALAIEFAGMRGAAWLVRGSWLVAGEMGDSRVFQSGWWWWVVNEETGTLLAIG